jgi:hypothetical protein
MRPCQPPRELAGPCVRVGCGAPPLDVWLAVFNVACAGCTVSQVAGTGVTSSAKAVTVLAGGLTVVGNSAFNTGTMAVSGHATVTGTLTVRSVC